MTEVTLRKLESSDKNQFILDNQRAFLYGATQEFGLLDSHFEDDGEIISRETIENSINHGEALRIIYNGNLVGGAVLNIIIDHGELELLFVSPEFHNMGIGYKAWCAIEKKFPEVKTWETCTPYFEKRNINFYVNRCGFHIVEYFNQFHKDPNETEEYSENDFDGMFRFVKEIRNNEQY